jgi:hypothetical protein
MMQNLPLYISIVFVLAVLYAVFTFWKAANRSRIVLAIILLWMTLHGALAYSGFYFNTKGLPPRFSLTIVPTLVAMIILFSTKKGRAFIDNLNLSQLSLLHLVRIPIEFVLLWLSIYKLVPQLITFEGHNFDIISGITAPLAWYFARRGTNIKLLLSWNIICLALLVNVVVTAILSAPFDFQQFSFNQPTTAVLYFPFVWLPAVVVPMVLFAHLASIRQLTRKKSVLELRTVLRE